MTEDDVVAAAAEVMLSGGAIFVVREVQDGKKQVTILTRKMDVQDAADAVLDAVGASDGVPSPFV